MTLRFDMQLECGPMPTVMAALGIMLKMRRSESSVIPLSYILCVIPFLVPRRKVWMTHTAGVPRNNTANIGERKTWTHSEFCNWQNSVRGQERQKCIYSVPVQETVKHRAN